MATNERFVFNQGYVSSRDGTELSKGELVSGVGAFYKPGDPTRIWKEQGRRLFHTVQISGSVDGLELLIFKEGSVSLFDSDLPGQASVDKLVTLVSGRLGYTAVSEDIGTTSIVSGIFNDAIGSGVLVPTKLFRVHYNDVHYVSTLEGRPFAIDVSTTTSGNIRRMGMLAPGDVPQLSGAAKATISLVPSGSQSADYYHVLGDTCNIPLLQFFMNPKVYTGYDQIISDDVALAYDNDPNTFAWADISSSNTLRTIRYTGFPLNTDTGRKLHVRFQVIPKGAVDPGGGDIGVGTSLGDTGVLLHIYCIYNSTSGHTPVLPYFQQGHVNAFSTEGVPGYNTSGYQPYDITALDLGQRLVYERYALSHERPVKASIDIPDNLDLTNMEVYFSFGPFSHTSITWDCDDSPGPPYTPNWNKVKDSTLRIYDIRVSDGSDSAVFGAPSGVRYCVTEYDTTRGLESIPGPQSQTLSFDDRAGAVITLPSGNINPNTNEYKVYRSNLPDGPPPSGVDDGWNNFGLVGKVPLDSGTVKTFVDDFAQFSIVQQPIPLVGTIQVDGDDQTTTFYLRDRAPVPMAAQTNFKGSLVGIDALNNRALRYSYAGYPESWPAFHVIDAFPFKDQDSLVGISNFSNVLVLLTKGVIMTMLEVPHVRQGRLVASDIKVIAGSPGCVGPYAYTDILWDNFPAIAYVSIHGILITDAHKVKYISRDLDWPAEVNANTLGESSLYYDRAFEILYFLFDKDGDGENDHYFTFHLNAIHRKQNGMPKILGPTPGRLTKLVGAKIENRYRMFSGSSTDQKLFEERILFADDSNSWSVTPGILPFNIMTGQNYADWIFWSVIRGNLRHTNWGSENIDVTWTAGRDDSNIRQIIQKTVSLTGRRGHEFLVNRLGEWHQIQMTHFTSGAVGGIHHIKGKAEPGGDAGDI